METLQLDKKTAKEIYPESSDWFKKVLAKSFGEECFKKRTFKDITSYEIAVEERPVSAENTIYPTDSRYYIAHKKLSHIVEVFRNGWVPDYSNPKQKKCYVWIDLSSGVRFVGSGFGYSYARTGLGSRFALETEEQAIAFFNQFIDLHTILNENK